MEQPPRIDPPPDGHDEPPIVAHHWGEWLRVLLPIALLVALAIAAAWPFLQPAPPRKRS